MFLRSVDIYHWVYTASQSRTQFLCIFNLGRCFIIIPEIF
jgi:hypothetical protein